MSEQDKVELILIYVSEAEYLTFNEAVDLACARDEQAAEQLRLSCGE